MKTIVKLFCCLIFVALALPAMAAEKTETEMPAITEVRTRVVTATVVTIDYTTRKMTLKGDEGNVADIEISPRVKNIKQVKAGDRVKVEFIETVAISARKSDGSKPGDKLSNEIVTVTRPGSKPVKVSVRVEEIITVVEAIDSEKRVINLKLPGGGVQTYFVPRKYEHLDNVKKGDQVVVRLSQSICIKLTKIRNVVKPVKKPAQESTAK